MVYSEEQMSPDVLEFAQVMTVLVGTAAASVVLALGTRVLWRLGSRPSRPATPQISREEFERLQTAVDAIAIEVERISEGQRFTVTLLSSQLGVPNADAGQLPKRGSRVDTPH